LNKYFKHININEEISEINLKFYIYLKYLTRIKLSDKIRNKLIGKLLFFEKYTERKKFLESFILNEKINEKNKDNLIFIFEQINNYIDTEIFIFALKLDVLKPLLLEEAKLYYNNNEIIQEGLNPLNLEYDKLTIYKPYSTRINGALLVLYFFENLKNKTLNFFKNESFEFVEKLLEKGEFLLNNGLELNQIFMLIFSESINQSIKSDSGSNYEDRIMQYLIDIGIPESIITKQHHHTDKSSEFDFFFTLNNKTVGISAKRTLRERYKQFLKTLENQDVDIFIQITLGSDLTHNKAETILRNGVILFVSDEIYMQKKFSETENIFPAKDLTYDFFYKITQ
jgi:hypothetical protein